VEYDQLANFLLDYVVQKINVIPLPLNDVVDSFYHGFSGNKDFTTKTAT